MTFATADISDDDPNFCRICQAALRDFGRRRTFWGQAVTLKVSDDHRPGIALCLEPGHGKILVIDGSGSSAVALFGGTMASISVRNGWAGAIVFGAIRDIEEMATYDLGVKALGTTPRSSAVPSPHECNVPLRFRNVTFNPGDWIYADADADADADAVLVRESRFESPAIAYQA